MDSFTHILSQCHLGTANDMDSPADFYGSDEKQQFANIKQEQDTEESNVGLVGHFLQREDSIDLEAYLRFDNHPNNQIDNTGDGILRQLAADVEGFGSEQMLNHTHAPTPGAQPNQLPVQQSIHYENITSMPQTTQPFVAGGHGGELTVEQAVPEFQSWVEINSTSTSAASSPGLPTSGDTYMDQSAEDHSMSSPGKSNGGSQKRKRPVPAPGTDEYKLKRERNNIAVRKSREKTKMKNKELQDKVGELQSENARLKKHCEGLTKELTVLKSLFTNTGKSPPAVLEKAVK